MSLHQWCIQDQVKEGGFQISARTLSIKGVNMSKRGGGGFQATRAPPPLVDIGPTLVHNPFFLPVPYRSACTFKYFSSSSLHPFAVLLPCSHLIHDEPEGHL